METQKLLTTPLSDFQAMILFWLEIGVKHIKVDLDLSTMDAWDDCELTFDTVGFALCQDDTWLSFHRYEKLDEDDAPYLADGENLITGETNPRRLVYRTLTFLATFDLDQAFDYEGERFENERNVYRECKAGSSPSRSCDCWRCRHARYPSRHIADCCLCRSIGRTVEAAEAAEKKAELIPF